MAASYDTPTRYQIDRISEELRAISKELRELNQKLHRAGETATYLLAYGVLIGSLIFALVQAAGRA